jgi:hypothetical protein
MAHRPNTIARTHLVRGITDRAILEDGPGLYKKFRQKRHACSKEIPTQDRAGPRNSIRSEHHVSGRSRATILLPMSNIVCLSTTTSLPVNHTAKGSLRCENGSLE